MHIPEFLSYCPLKINWNSKEELSYEQITITDKVAILDNREGYLFYFEQDSWEDDVRKSYKCFINDNKMICLNIPHDLEDCKKCKFCLEGFFKERRVGKDGGKEWVKLPYKFVLKCNELLERNSNQNFHNTTI